jgi:hypothetical protein
VGPGPTSGECGVCRLSGCRLTELEVIEYKTRVSHVLRNMKTAIFIALALLITAAGYAQNYAIDWYSIDGGGGGSTNSQFALSGTIGQPDAGHMSGGAFKLDGGFWGIVAAVQTPGGPLLRVVLTGTNTVVVAWPNASTGFSLQQNGALGTVNWTGVTNPISVVGSENQIIVAPPAGNRFYRLFHP